MNELEPAMRKSLLLLMLLTLSVLCSTSVRAEEIGAVSTAWNLLGPDHRIVIEVYDDEAVQGIACHISRAKTGGVMGGLGLAEDKAEASIACRQVGPLKFKRPVAQQEEVFSERQSVLFKKLRVVRVVDVKRNTLVYLTYSDRLIDGSPKNSITSVPVNRDQTIPVKK
jgi:CreA protein